MHANYRLISRVRADVRAEPCAGRQHRGLHWGGPGVPRQRGGIAPAGPGSGGHQAAPGVSRHRDSNLSAKLGQDKLIVLIIIGLTLASEVRIGLKSLVSYFL